ncbi:hypothetical protein [Natrononativus amylolyticus]|uniref:hypothetical protein n=1 Tax=Natrononativus amylolyticus TaxID=2963434 RepID=UPI0020CFBB48|nr:hypothetical protein [Natrononativus amylolyticus]
MNSRHIAGIAIGVLALLCVGLVLSVVYPFSTMESQSTNPAEDRFSGIDSDEYSITASYDGEGGTNIELRDVKSADGERYHLLGTDSNTYEEYQEHEGAPVYQRFLSPDRTYIDHVVDRANDDESLQILEEKQSDETITLILKEERSGVYENSATSESSVFIRSFFVASYAQVEQTDETNTYRPENGWYGTYRITNSSGEVHAEPDTNVVRSANVSFDLTQSAESYAEYLVATVVSDETVTIEIMYDAETENVEVEIPEWAEEARSDQ